MSIESIRPQLDDETCKKLAVWLCDNALKTTSYYIQEAYEALKEYAEKGMTISSSKLRERPTTPASRASP